MKRELQLVPKFYNILFWGYIHTRKVDQAEKKTHNVVYIQFIAKFSYKDKLFE